MSAVVSRGDLVWTPPSDVMERTKVGAFLRWLADNRGLKLGTHEELWRWSVTDLSGFWSAVWDYFGVVSHALYTAVLESPEMPGTQWFTGARLNYAEHASGTADDFSRTAVLTTTCSRPEPDTKIDGPRRSM